MLEIKNLHANINGKEILKGINLSVKAGEVHAIMGPNGSGKSTLSSVLVGNPAFDVTEGEVIFNGKNLLDLEPEDRSREGIFLSFQYPVEIPGVSMVNFMRAAVNEQRKYKGLPALTASEFLKLMREKRAVVELDNKLANRSVNEGFSGGEKKKAEILQLLMLKPDLAILDIMLPDEDGLEIVGKLRRRPETKKLPVIMVTAKTTEIDKVKGLDVGADDYLTKPFGVMELIARVKAVLRRTMEEEKFLSLGDVFLDDEKHMVYVKDQPCSLTFKEYELLKLLLHNAGIVVTREIILERVWGIDFEGESRTLDMHIRTLRQKLGDAGTMIRTVRNVGYMIE